MAWKETVTKVSSNIFPDLGEIKISSDIGTYEASPSMPLQMFLFFNVFLFPFWFSTSTFFLYLKFECLGNLTKFLSVAVLMMYSAIECMRLYLGYRGNLSERIPELAGFWMLSILLQLPLQSFQLGNPYLQARPLEITLHCLMWLLLMAQLFTGFLALRAASARAKSYYSFKSLSQKGRAENNKEELSEDKLKDD